MDQIFSRRPALKCVVLLIQGCPMKVLGVAALLFVLSIGHGSAHAQAVDKATERVNASKDESLTTQEYIRLGMPAPDREWSGMDLDKAAATLTTLVQTNPRGLPRFENERSGEMFARITSPKNMDMFASRKSPLSVRFPMAMSYFQAHQKIVYIYLPAFQKNDVRDCELVEIMGSLTRLTVLMLDMTNEFLPTLDKNDPSYPTRMKGVETMKRGLANVVSGGLTTLTESNEYRASERIRLIGHMKESFPKIFPHLMEDSRTEMLRRMEELQADPALKELHPALKGLDAKIKAALAPQKTP